MLAYATYIGISCRCHAWRTAVKVVPVGGQAEGGGGGAGHWGYEETRANNGRCYTIAAIVVAEQCCLT